MNTCEVLGRIESKETNRNFSLVAIRDGSAAGINYMPLMKDCRRGWPSEGDGRSLCPLRFNAADVLTMQAWANGSGIGELQWGLSGGGQWARLHTPITGDQLCALRRWLIAHQRIARSNGMSYRYPFGGVLKTYRSVLQ